MFFEAPHYLWLLCVAVIAMAVYFGHKATGSRLSLIGSAILRVLAIVLVVLALARPILFSSVDRREEVAVIDVSASLQKSDITEIRKGVEDWLLSVSLSDAAAVLVESRPRLIVGDELKVLPETIISDWEEGQRNGDNVTPLADALLLASSRFEEAGDGRIMLFSDGLNTSGDACAIARQLNERGVTVEAHSAGSVRENELVLQNVVMPSVTGAGETVDVVLRLDSGQAGNVDIAIVPSGENEPVVRQSVAIESGVQDVRCSIPLAGDTGVRTFEVTCSASWDLNDQNNRREISTVVEAPYRVAVVETGDFHSCAEALGRLVSPAAEIVTLTPGEVPADPEGYASYSAVVLSDVPADQIAEDAQEALSDAVERGMGLMFAGGPSLYGPGSYGDGALAEILPLRFEQKIEKRDPSVTLVIIIDTSGSMKGPRIDLAKEIARLAIQRLQPHDKVGIVEFYGTKRWAARIQSAGNRIDVNRALNRLSAGGGTIILPALEEAYYALLNVRTRTKHVLIITDGGVETGPFEEVVSRMADAGITVSTVVAGPGQYSGFLTSLAHWGKGKSYAAPDRFNLPEILLKQPESVPQSMVVETPSRMIPRMDSVVTETIPFEQAPSLGGYVRSKARETSDVWLVSEAGDPILASWQMGRGRVTALTSDIGGAWSADMLGWAPYATLVSNLFRQMATNDNRSPYDIRMVQRPAGVEIDVTYAGHSPDDLLMPLTLEMTSPDGSEESVVVDPVSLGHWNTLVESTTPGVVVVDVRGGKGRTHGAAAMSFNSVPEISATRPDQAFLNEVAAPGKTVERAGNRKHYTELWPWCVLAALCCQMLNILVRRWPRRQPAKVLAAGLLVLLITPSGGWAADRVPIAEDDLRTAAIRYAEEGDTPAAMEKLADIPSADSTYETWLLRGLFASRLGNYDRASTCYATAATLARRQSDRSFAYQGCIDAARKASQLDALADEWLVGGCTPLDRLPHLVGLLRELGRANDAISLLDCVGQDWNNRDINPADIQNEIIATAIESGHPEIAERVYLERLANNPHDLPVRSALSRLYIRMNHKERAESLFREAGRVADSVDESFRVANAALSLALDAVAIDIVDSMGALKPADAFQAALWHGKQKQQKGDIEGAVQAVEQAEKIAGDDSGLLLQVADAYEQMQSFSRACDILETILQQGDNGDVRQRLAWILEQIRRPDDARRLWYDMWIHAETEAQRNRAAERLLDLSARTNTLADLAIEIEEKLLENKASAYEVALLVDLYTQMGDAVSTAEVLHLFANNGENEVQALTLLVRAYIKMGRLVQADEILRTLLKIDPEHRYDYLQEITVLAVERNRPDVAEWAIGRLAAVAGDETIARELSAGVYDLLGEHERAADAYAATLERYPERIDVWLLWANAKQEAGKTQEAIDRLEQLAMDDTIEDDLLLVAVDGLMNLDASPDVLKRVLERILVRGATKPNKLYFYDIACDIYSTIGETGKINPLMELALVFAGSERGSLLREMVERAKADGNDDRVIAYGKSLVAMDYQVPPQVFIDLGRTLLANDEEVEADRAFTRARAVGSDETVGPQVAQAYDEVLLPERALSVVNELLALHPNDVASLQQAAGFHEQLGQFDEALAQYRQSLFILLDRMPDTSDTPADVPLSRLSTGRRRRIAANLDELTLYLGPAIDGMIASARTDEAQSRVVADLMVSFREALDAASENSSEQILLFPRLAQLSALIRYSAFTLNQPNVADELDRVLLDRFPKDAELAATILDERLQWGFAARAIALGENRIPIETWPVELRVQRILMDEALLNDTLSRGPVDPEVAIYLLPRLIMMGRDDQALWLIQSEESPLNEMSRHYAKTMLTGAVALDQESLISRWAFRLLDLCQTNGNRDLGQDVTLAIRLSWPYLDDTRRQALYRKVESISSTDDRVVTSLNRIRILMAMSLELDPKACLDAVESILASLGKRNRRMIPLVMNEAVEPEEVVRRLEEAWTRCEEVSRFDFLLSVASYYGGPFGEELSAAYQRLLDATPVDPLNRHTPYRSLIRGGWASNHTQPAIGVLVADRVLQQYPHQVAAMVAAASAYRNAGQYDRAARQAEIAFGLIRANRSLDEEEIRMIRGLVNALSPEYRQNYLANVAQAKARNQAGIMDLFCAGLILANDGQAVDALERIGEAFQRDPSDQYVRRTLLDLVEENALWNLLPPLLGPYLANSAVVQSYELNVLANAYHQRLQPAEALRVLATGDGVMSTTRILELEDSQGRADRVLLRVRRYMAKNRSEQRFYVPRSTLPPLEGGLANAIERQASDYNQWENLFALLVHDPDVLAEFQSLWQSAHPTRNDVQRLTVAITQGAVDAENVDALAGTLVDRLESDELNARDMQLLTTLLTEQNAVVNLEGQDILSRMMTIAPGSRDDALEGYSRMLMMAGRTDEARNVLRWVIATDLGSPHDSLYAVSRFRRIDLYASSLPESQRETWRNKALIHSVLTPADSLMDRFDSKLLGESSPVREKELPAVRARLQVEPADTYRPYVYRAMTSIAARQGDQASYVDGIDALLGMTDRAYGGLYPADPNAFLPNADTIPEVGLRVEEFRAATMERVLTGNLQKADGVKALVLMAHWCMVNNRKECTQSLLSDARGLADDSMTQVQLWIADLTRALNSPDAIDIELGLLDQGTFPMVRLVDLLNDLEQAKGQEEADRMAYDLFGETDQLEVMRRAWRHARRNQDQAAVKAIEEKCQRLRLPAFSD